MNKIRVYELFPAWANGGGIIDDMYKCRVDGVERVNALFGTEIKVYKNSSWEDVDIESDLDHDDVSARAEDGDGDKDEQNSGE